MHHAISMFHWLAIFHGKVGISCTSHTSKICGEGNSTEAALSLFYLNGDLASIDLLFVYLHHFGTNYTSYL